ncbi:MAG: hypothetical protein GF330_04040 [Candidatus Eisenbacteria bacterium]|nr:hypothetical protein [Candidatus Eisenbacteria bacterium]
MRLHGKAGRRELIGTKIVATLGPARAGIHDPDGSECREPVAQETALRWFAEAGADLLRLNMAYFEPPGGLQREIIQILDAHRAGWARRLALLGDLPGPKIRLRIPAGGALELTRGMTLLVDASGRWAEGAAPEAAVSSGAEPLVRVVASGEPFDAAVTGIDGQATLADYVRQARLRGQAPVFYIGDGPELILQAIGIAEGSIRCRVEEGGRLEENSAFTIKYARVDLPSFQEADRRALDFLLEEAGDLLACVGVSFVRDSQDIIQVRRHIETHLCARRKWDESRARRCSPAIIAKIETADAYHHIDEILDVADGIMVARGDLGLQLDPEDVPQIQKEIIRRCNLRGKPVITATQMLNSMIQGDRTQPTRAEATDVFNAILDGSDAVMLSGETSVGRHPIAAIRMLGRIAQKAEAYFRQGGLDATARRRGTMNRFRDLLGDSDALIDATTRRLQERAVAAMEAGDTWLQGFYQEKLRKIRRQRTTDGITHSACMLSEGSAEYQAIVAATASGRTPRMLARYRPNVRIIGAAHDPCNFRKLLISHGVYPVLIGQDQQTHAELFRDAVSAATEPECVAWAPRFRLLRRQGEVIFTAGTPMFTPGTTNVIQVRPLGAA